MFSDSFNAFIIAQLSKAIVELRKLDVSYIEDEDEAAGVCEMLLEHANVIECFLNDFKFNSNWIELFNSLWAKGGDDCMEYVYHYLLHDDRENAVQVGMTVDFVDAYCYSVKHKDVQKTLA